MTGGPPSWMDDVLLAVRAKESDYFSRHMPPPRHRGRRAAVLMLYGPHPAGGEDVVLTQRTAHLRSHAGQVSFPGGRIDPDDDGPVGAALREAHEEIGLDPSGVEILGELPELFLSASNSSVTPVLGWWERPTPVYAHSAEEVERVVRVPVAELTTPRNRFTAVHPSGYRSPAYTVDGLFIWGFTAALLTATLDLAGIDPGGWDPTVEREVPRPGPPLPTDRTRTTEETR
ncbi:NUDIX domain-containing protein [Austwickia chelonae]|uniref:Nudix hydrolase domain-containing protein n=1 Tax=Austwickia chelonae NBRC 105200 TaxID=1184607 RepID=K6VK20_9MICO|nr:CoA pyrophosphatase [Austwickia chelonae]GAB77044.1 hypothetical protein AUCHE_04_00850 [Austwickia chelonae NBRC 105200]SEW33534.1 NUDIX domain-containing protein [Austwickia chelonae]